MASRINLALISPPVIKSWISLMVTQRRVIEQYLETSYPMHLQDQQRFQQVIDNIDQTINSLEKMKQSLETNLT